jgi:sulfate adenylyltransferase subunit 2
VGCVTAGRFAIYKCNRVKIRVKREIFVEYGWGMTAGTLKEQAPPLAGIVTLPARHLSHLQRLEAESIHIMREVAAEFANPVMLYSIGKDSSVMLHLAMKAFYPSKPPFPLMHVDTMWKFRDMISFRDETVKRLGVKLIIYVNEDGVRRGINPFDSGSNLHTQVMKTDALKAALDQYGFDAAFGGARRDEEKSRAKERVFSFRSENHAWDPKNQRPELWKLYNARIRKGESIRVFPLSNWTELDVWQYIMAEKIPVVPLYFAKQRPVVDRDGAIILVDDERMRLEPGEAPQMRMVRFRTLGCYPLTGAIESAAATLEEIVSEMLTATTSERQGRVIDRDENASMERKKREGYF